jgi:hypothetical protein
VYFKCAFPAFHNTEGKISLYVNGGFAVDHSWYLLNVQAQMAKFTVSSLQVLYFEIFDQLFASAVF